MGTRIPCRPSSRGTLCVDIVFKQGKIRETMSQRAEHLHIRVSEHEKAAISRAALVKRMSISQFILQTAVPVAEEIVKQDEGTIQTLFKLDADAWEEFNRLLDAPARDIPALRELLLSKAPWEE